MKILAINDESGSKYHRIKLPLSFLSPDQADVRIKRFPEMKKEDLKWCDILFYNGIINLMPHELSILRARYNFKIVIDIDDYWVLPPQFPDRDLIVAREKWFIEQMIIADAVITTTKRLGEYIDPYNSNVWIIPNRIPRGHGQFTSKPTRDISKKIRIGICGSISHYADYKILVPVLNKIIKSKELRDKFHFVIAGVNYQSKGWDAIINMFNGLEYSILEHLPPDNYMNLYDNIDVLLAPLADNTFNWCKSDLKLQEAACKDIVVLSTRVYKNSGSLMNHYICDKPDDWINHLNIFNGLYTSPVSDPYTSYKQENERRIELFRSALGFIKKRPSVIKIYSIIYDKSQVTEYPTVFNDINTIEDKSYLFEYNPIINIIKNGVFSESTVIGILSHKFPYKTQISRDVLIHKLQKIGYDEFDVIGLCDQNLPFIKKKKYYSFTEQQHPGFMKLFTNVCHDLDLVSMEPYKVVFSNFFVAKYSFWKEYIKIAESAIELMETKYKDLAWRDSTYRSGLAPKELKEQTGLDYYPMHTFVLERLLSAYLTTNRFIKFKQLL